MFSQYFYGDVKIKNNAKVKMSAKNEIIIENNFETEYGAELILETTDKGLNKMFCGCDILGFVFRLKKSY